MVRRGGNVKVEEDVYDAEAESDNDDDDDGVGGENALRGGSGGSGGKRLRGADRVTGPEGLPFCSFNGGLDVFVDVGNKAIGIDALMRHPEVQASGQETLHFGDQFRRTGNDLLARRTCATAWVASPEETLTFLEQITATQEVV